MADTVETAIYRLQVEGQAEIDRLTKSIDDMAVAEEKATAATRTFSQGLQNNIARLDPLVRAQENYRKALEANARYRETGVGTEAQLNAQLAAATERYQTQISVLKQGGQAVNELAEAHKGLNTQGQAAFHSIRSMVEMLAMGVSPIQAVTSQMSHLSYAASGEGGIAGAFKQVGTLLGGLISPINVAIAGMAALAAGAAYAALQFDKVQKSSERALIGAGARTGTSVGDLNRFVEQSSGVGGSQLSQKEARTLGEDLTKSGEIVISQLHGMSDAVVGFATLTNKSMSEASKDIVRFATDPKKALDELAKTYGDFDNSTKLAVDALTKAGDKTAAWQVIVDALAETNKKAVGSMDMATLAARTFGNALATEATKPTDLQQRLEKLNAIIAKTEEAMKGMFISPEAADDMAKLRKEAEDLQKAIDKIDATKATAELNHLKKEAEDATKSLTPQIGQLEKLDDQIAALERAKEAGVTSKYGAAADDAAETAARNQRQITKESQDEAARYNERVREIARSWSDVGVEVAKQLQVMKNQLPVVEAIGGAAKMAAQAAADYANAMDKGAKPAEAARLAAEKLATAQAQANTQSKEAVWQLQNQAKVIEQTTGLKQGQVQTEASLNQLASQLTGVKKLEAEEQGKINQLTHDGVSAEQAAVQAAQEKANALQQVNAAALQRLQQLQLELEMAQAVTGQQQQMVQYQQSLNKMLGDGVDQTLAMAVAEKEYEVSVAKASASVWKQVEALKDSTAMIEARRSGSEAETAGAIAYKNAIESGASALAASALSAATVANELAKAESSAKHLGGWTASFQGGAFDVPGSGPGGGKTGANVSLNPFVSPYGYSGGQTPGISFADQVTAAGAGGVQAALSLAMGTQARAPTYAYDPEAANFQGAMVQQGVTEQEIISQVGSLYDLMNQQTTDKAAQATNLQSELAWLQSRPTSIAQQQQIAQLRQSLDSLTKSTDSLNSTNQDLLSPYYTQDPRTSHIGFRSQGMAAGGYVDVPGGYSANDNLIASIPVASGERIYVDPMTGKRGTASGGSLTINISSPVLIQGNANKDDVGRTMFQNNQNLAKQMRAAMQ